MICHSASDKSWSCSALQHSSSLAHILRTDALLASKDFNIPYFDCHRVRTNCIGSTGRTEESIHTSNWHKQWENRWSLVASCFLHLLTWSSRNLRYRLGEDRMVETTLEAFMKIGAKLGQSRPALTVRSSSWSKHWKSWIPLSRAAFVTSAPWSWVRTPASRRCNKRKKERKNRQKQSKSRFEWAYAKVVGAQDLLDPLHQIFASVSVRAK